MVTTGGKKFKIEPAYGASDTTNPTWFYVKDSLGVIHYAGTAKECHLFLEESMEMKIERFNRRFKERS
jgi:hypothetical protein